MAIRVTHAPPASGIAEAAFAGGKEERDRYLEQFALKKHEAEARELAQFQANQRADRAMNIKAMQFAQRREDAQLSAAMQARRQDMQMVFGLREAELDRRAKAENVAGITERSAARDAADMARFQAGVKEREGNRDLALAEKRKADLLAGMSDGLKSLSPYLSNLDMQPNQDSANEVRANVGKLNSARRQFINGEQTEENFREKTADLFGDIQNEIDTGRITRQQSAQEMFDATVLTRNPEGVALTRLVDGEEKQTVASEILEARRKEDATTNSAKAKVDVDAEKTRLDNRNKAIAAIGEMAEKAGEGELARLQAKAQADEKFGEAPTALSATDQARMFKEATQAYLDIGRQYDAATGTVGASGAPDETTAAVNAGLAYFNAMPQEEQDKWGEALKKRKLQLMMPPPEGPGLSETEARAQAWIEFGDKAPSQGGE